MESSITREIMTTFRINLEYHGILFLLEKILRLWLEYLYRVESTQYRIKGMLNILSKRWKLGNY